MPQFHDKPEPMWLLCRKSPGQRRRRPLLDPVGFPEEYRLLLQAPQDIDLAIRAMQGRAEELLNTRIDVHVMAIKTAQIWAFEACAQVIAYDRLGRQQRQVMQIVCGRDADTTLREAAYFGLRKLLVGDAAVCGVLLDLPNVVQVALNPIFQVVDKYMLTVQLAPGQDHVPPPIFKLPVGQERRRDDARTSYLVVTSIPPELERRFGAFMSFKKTPVRLHRLIVAMKHVCIREGYGGETWHVHHENGVGGDARDVNLTPMPVRTHVAGHFLFSRDGVILDRGDHPVEVAMLVTREGQSSNNTLTRHRRTDARLRLRHSRQASDCRILPLAARMNIDLAVLRATSRRPDFQLGALAILDCLATHRRSMSLGEICRATSMAKATARGRLAKLSRTQLVVTWTENRQLRASTPDVHCRTLPTDKRVAVRRSKSTQDRV